MNDRFFRNGETGEVVIGQAPNRHILIGKLALLVAWLFPDDKAGHIGRVVAATAFTIWGVDEVVRGESPFRRTLGLLALGGLAALAVRALR